MAQSVSRVQPHTPETQAWLDSGAVQLVQVGPQADGRSRQTKESQQVLLQGWVLGTQALVQACLVGSQLWATGQSFSDWQPQTLPTQTRPSLVMVQSRQLVVPQVVSDSTWHWPLPAQHPPLQGWVGPQ